MLDRSLAAIERAFGARIDDLDTWLALATWIRRSGVVPGFLRADEHLEPLLSLWASTPEERGLAPMLEPLLGIRPLLRERREPGSWWAEHGRLGEHGDHYYDSLTGLPLLVEDLASGMELAWIPPGSFLMGSAEDDPLGFVGERPQHRVTLSDGFWLGVFPVTQREFAAVMDYDPSQEQGERRPVDSVTRSAAVRFGWTLSRLHRGDGRLQTAAEYRLPTEAEWEYACRAGTTTARYLPDVDAIAWTLENGGESSHPVGEKLPNAWGLFDMLGNVWEWCLDPYHRDYVDAPEDGTIWQDPADVDRSWMVFVCRGGAWGYEGFNARAARRTDREGRSRPAVNANYVGFRCLLSTSIRRSFADDQSRHDLTAEQASAVLIAATTWLEPGDWNPDCRREVQGALNVLTDTADPAGVPALLRFLGSGALVAARRGEDQAALTDRLPIDHLTFEALRALPSAEIRDHLGLCFEGPDSGGHIHVLRNTLYADRRYIEVYRHALRSPNVDLRRVAAFTFQAVFREEDEPLLREVLETERDRIVISSLRNILDRRVHR